MLEVDINVIENDFTDEVKEKAKKYFNRICK